jgi:hypothetical protein
VNTAEIIFNLALLFYIGSVDLFGDKPSSHPNDAAGAKLMAIEVHRYLK